ncbi:MAG TPA: sulfite exporter TauE/SafE family protein [Gaiellaceae bacterium]
MRLVLIGLVAGFFSALFGVGGGIIIVPLLLLVGRWEIRSATATSLAAIGITAVAGVAAYVLHHDVQTDYAALLGVPAAAGAICGAALQQRIHGRVLSLGFAVLLVGIAVDLLVK